MWCLWFSWSSCVFFCCVFHLTSGLRLAGCSGDHDAIELTENQSGQQTRCEDIAQNQTIQWAFEISGQVTVLATCDSPNQPCDNVNTAILTATRDSTSSTATFVKSAGRPGGTGTYSGYDVICRPVGGSGVSCPIDTIYSPSSSEVSCSVTTSTRWNITVSCTVSKAYSALNRYRCDFRQGSSSGTSVGKSTYSSAVSSGYTSGTCTSTFPMPTSSGTYTYTVIVYPGVRSVSASGSVTVGLHLAGCSGHHDAIELTENQSGQQTRCEDISQNQQIQWALEISGQVTVLARCNSPNQPCYNVNTGILTATRDSTSSTATFVKSAGRPGGTGSYNGYDVLCRPAGGSGVTCPIDTIYSPSSSEVSCSVTTSTRWTITVSCTVSKAYSALNRYRCDFRQGSSTGTSVGKSTYSSAVSSGYTSGTCTSTFPRPTSPGTYTYTVIVYPGVRSVSASGSVTVARPNNDPTITCTTQNGYIRENTALECRCTASDLGQPQGRLRVYRDNTHRVSGNYGNSSVQFGESSVSSADNNAVYRCVLDWATSDSEDRNTTFTLNVAYGPTRADLTDPQVYDLHPTQSNPPLTLTCSAVGVHPGANYSWSGSQCAEITQSTCSFTPTQGDNGDTISCTAVNTITSVGKTSETRTLRIHYPPSSAPVITGYSGQVLYAGNTQTMTCTVQGGNPAVSSVTFTCDSGGQVSGVSSTIEVTASRDNNGKNCTCSAKWKNKSPSWYTLTDSVTLQVYYPPVPPTIDHRQQKYPFLAGESPTLYCTLPSGTDSGNPPATLTLTFEGQTGSPGQREVNVTLPVLTSADNGRRVVCEANNAFTVHSNTPVTQNRTLQVYYISQTITPLPPNTCTMTSPDTCQVKEGQRVHVSCSADSYPSPATVSWQQALGSSFDFTAERSLPLTHVCDATTTTVSSDDRLPLRSNITLTVLTTYAADVSQFTVNNTNNVTVSEGDPVTLTCTAVGRPTAAMSIVKEGVTLKSKQQGQVSAVEEATLTHMKDGATCDATGQYRCDADNGEGQPDSAHLMVFVNCSPRQQEGSPEIPRYLNYKRGSVSAAFPLTMYPAVKNATLNYLGPLSDSTVNRPARDSLYKVQCTATDLSRLYWTTCYLTIRNGTQNDKGFYSLTLRNGVGPHFSILFELDINGTEIADPSSFPIIAVFCGTVIPLVLLLIIAGVIICMMRRKRTGRKQDRHDRAVGVEPPLELELSPYASSDATNDTGPYEELKPIDIGLKSVYSAMSPPPHTSGTDGENAS
ncbi:uncharacterized protein LOC143277324 isoform X3 [Babylonia areolata]|uniref:uncharacterized protein LOC143277324 isoform X3 n=1 Tax=Babylonia areolata TaxID=304850 RepID=UPI003FD0E4D8